MSMREVARGQNTIEKWKWRQPQLFTGTSAIFSLTTAPRVDWVKGTHKTYGYHDGLGQNQKDF